MATFISLANNRFDPRIDINARSNTGHTRLLHSLGIVHPNEDRLSRRERETLFDERQTTTEEHATNDIDSDEWKYPVAAHSNL